jgi:serine phosphatase RsbU (regulator of sigma subunit)/anti-sigma regulatory factor (Ser/Thr protein kinase)/anti-anti-sigma regulatory factor
MFRELCVSSRTRSAASVRCPEDENRTTANAANGTLIASRADEEALSGETVAEERLDLRDILAIAREIFDAVPVLVLAFGGPDHRVIAANAACRAFLGRDDLIGRTNRETFPELAGQQLYEVLDRVHASGEPHVAREWRCQVSRGRGTIVESYIDFVCAPWHGPDGSVGGVVIAANDTTARVQERNEALGRAAEADRRYAAARDVVVELQQALLPTMLPVLPQARVAARYLVAGHEQAAGGDWFDAIVLADGIVALVVGDVVGHGVTATAAMGQLRAVLNDRLAANPDLAEALAETDAFAVRTPSLHAATLALVALDPADGALRYATCGHPAPLVISGDGRTRFLPPTGSGPLGIGSVPVLSPGQLEPGELVLLYSDGLIERPGRTARNGLAELAKVAADAALNRAMPVGAAPTAPERVCQLTIELLTRTGYADDVTALAAQRLPEPVAPLQLELPATLDALTTARRALSEWMQPIDPVADDRAALQLAVAEILLNSVEHAYPPGKPGMIGLDLSIRDEGYVECRIADHGTWQPPQKTASSRGHGLMLVEHLIDDVLISHPPQVASVPKGTRGTMVTLRHRFRRPAILGTESSAHHCGHLSAEPFEVVAGLAGNASLAAVRGPVDVFSAEQFTRELLAISGGGTLSLTVDLAEVSQLASAGVSALFQVREQLTAQQQDLTLIAERGSDVATVLELVGLPYHPPAAPQPPGLRLAARRDQQ